MKSMKLVVSAAITALCYIILTNSVYSVNNQDSDLLYVKKDKDRVIASWKYDEANNMYIEFKKCGINSIMGIYAISLVPVANSKSRAKLPTSDDIHLKSDTDWISPYIVKCNQYKDKSEPCFTGGWHSMEINGKPSPTASTINVSVSLNRGENLNEPINDGEYTQCKSINIDVMTLIQAYNTACRPELENKNVIKESVYYTIHQGRVDVSAEIEALNNIVISRYYGIQTQNSAWKERIFYNKGAHSCTGVDSQLYNDSGAKKDFPDVDKYTLYSKSGIHKLISWIDRGYGLGKMENVSNINPCAFTLPYGKSYFNLINGKDLEMEKGEKLYWRGGYILEKSNDFINIFTEQQMLIADITSIYSQPHNRLSSIYMLKS